MANENGEGVQKQRKIGTLFAPIASLLRFCTQLGMCDDYPGFSLTVIPKTSALRRNFRPTASYFLLRKFQMNLFGLQTKCMCVCV